MSVDPADLVFKSRALAQAHPLTPLASRYMKRAIARQQADQPLPEIGIWAGGALLDGYCLRRVQEDSIEAQFTGLDLDEDEDIDEAPGAELDRLELAATAIASQIRSGSDSDAERRGPGTETGAEGTEHGDGPAGDVREGTIAALDLLIAKGVERRLDHWRDAIDDEAWGELEGYLTWWVVQGYALRVAELHAGLPTGDAAEVGTEGRS